jgi:hypothetical protein
MFVAVAIPNNPDLDLIKVKQVLLTDSELGSPKLVAKAYVFIELLN